MDSKKKELAELKNTLEGVKDLLEGIKSRRMKTDITEHLTFEELENSSPAPALSILWPKEYDDIMNHEISSCIDDVSKNLMWIGKVKEFYKWEKNQQLTLRIKYNSDLNFTLFPMKLPWQGDIVIDKLGYVNLLMRSDALYCRTQIENITASRRNLAVGDQFAWMRLECDYNQYVFNEVYDGECQL